MAGNLREFTVPGLPIVAASKAAVTAVSTDAQETLYKRMRLEKPAAAAASAVPEPIGGGIIMDDIQRTRLRLLIEKDRQKQDFTQAEFLEYVALQILNDSQLNFSNDALKTQLGTTTMFPDKIQNLVKLSQQLRQTQINDQLNYTRLKTELYDAIEDIFSSRIEQKDYPKWLHQPPGTVYAADSPTADTNPNSPRTQPQQPQQTLGKNEQQLKALEDDLSFIVRSGLGSLYYFVGMLATTLGEHDVRSYYKWRGANADLDVLQDPIQKGAKTKEEFIRKNSHLGRPLLEFVLEQTNKVSKSFLEPVDADINVPRSVEDERTVLDLLNSSFVNQNAMSAQGKWIFGAIDEAVFAAILNDTTVGALRLAHSKLKRIPNCRDFTLKELIFSDGVNDIFAKFVGWEFLQASGGNAYSKGITSRGMVKGSTFMLSAGFDTRRALFAQVETAQIWFQDVRRVMNPEYAEIAAFALAQKDEIDEMEASPLYSANKSTNNVAALYKLRKTFEKKSRQNQAMIDYVNKKLDLVVAQQKLLHMPKTMLRHFE
jgi:hypothetical protein